MSFAIDFANPRAGWIDITLQLADAEPLAFPASHVLNDPIRELAELALFIATGERGRLAVRFWLEPQGYELAAIRDGACSLVLSYSDDMFPQLRAPAIVREQVVDAPRAIASEMLRSLRAIASHLPVEGSSSLWQHPFPTASVERLAEALAAGL